MARRHGFVPTVLDALEARVVLSRRHGVSAVVSGLSPHLQVINSQQQSTTALVDQAFASFQSDYDQARATYFASIEGTTTPSAATTSAFSLYTTQRVFLLSQQLVNIFVQSPQGTAHAPSQPYALKQLVSTKIIGAQGQHPVGSLERSLINTIPPAGTSSATASLYTLSQDDAIQSAQVAVLNGVKIIKSGAFGIQKVSHY